jgi:hypothetical protein
MIYTLTSPQTHIKTYTHIHRHILGHIKPNPENMQNQHTYILTTLRLFRDAEQECSNSSGKRTQRALTLCDDVVMDWHRDMDF